MVFLFNYFRSRRSIFNIRHFGKPTQIKVSNWVLRADIDWFCILKVIYWFFIKNKIKNNQSTSPFSGILLKSTGDL